MKTKTISKKLFLVGFGCMMAFFSCEICVRVIAAVGIRPGYSVHDIVENTPKYVWSKYSAPLLSRKRSSFVFWGSLIDKPTKVKINHLGYRGNLVSSYTAKNKIRILYLGGSHVFDLAAPENKDWPSLTRQYLKTDVEILNAGVPGHKTQDNLAKFYLELHMWQPDIVVFCGAWNDIKYFASISKQHSLLASGIHHSLPSEPNKSGSTYNTLDYILGWSWAYAKVRQKYYENILPKEDQKLQVLQKEFSPLGPDQYKLNLRMLYEACRAKNVQLFVVKQARLADISNTASARKKIHHYMAGLEHGTLCRAFDECDHRVDELQQECTNIQVVNTAEISGQEKYFHDHIHTSSAGSEALAQLVAANIQRYLDKASK